MARNIEIKARIGSVQAVLPRAQALADAPAQTLDQDDTFFAVPAGHGRLKLREFADGSAELIHYQRSDSVEAKASDYVLVRVVDPLGLREALTRAFGQLGRVRKRRLLLKVGATRIHLDQVEGLPDHMELEVVLRDEQSDEEGAAIADALMHQLGLADAPRVAVAYLDLLRGCAQQC
jgi:adenylate cyclase class IV